MKVLWLDINSSYSHSSLALAAIEANKTNHQNIWDKVSGTIQSDIFSITREVVEKKPDVVAATLWLFTHEVVVKILKRIKTLLPSVTIVVGGPEMNGCNHNFLLRNNYISAAFRGEGEVMFHKWLENFDNPQKWKDIEGVCYLDSENNYIDNGTARVMEFSSLRYPEQSPFFDTKSPFVQLESSRGCFNSCAFCTSSNDKPIRNISIKQVEQRLHHIDSLGIKEIRILDRTFNYSTSRAIELIELFEKFPLFNFHLEVHPALLKSQQLRDKIKAAPKGLLHIEAGLQSLNNEVLIASGRKGNSDEAIDGVKFLCALENIEIHTDLIAGLPKYSLKQIFDDVKTLSSINAGEIQLELLKLLPGTSMRRNAKELGIRFVDDPPYEVLESSHISIEELNQSRLLSKLIDKFYNAKGWQEITRLLINENSQFLSHFFEYMESTSLLDQPLSLEKRGSLLFNFCRQHYPNYVTKISLQWICNGMSLKREEAGQVSKLTEIPSELPQDNMRYYTLNRGCAESYIIGFNRSKEHSKPQYIGNL